MHLSHYNADNAVGIIRGQTCFNIAIPQGVLKFSFGRDVPPRNLKVDPYKYQFFKKNDPFIYQSAQFLPKFLANSPDFAKICLNLSQFWLKFGGIKIKKTHSYAKFCVL